MKVQRDKPKSLANSRLELQRQAGLLLQHQDPAKTPVLRRHPWERWRSFNPESRLGIGVGRQGHQRAALSVTVEMFENESSS